MGIHETLEALAEQRELSEDEAAVALRDIEDGTAKPEDAERFAAALHARGETPDELVAMAGVMRQSTTSVAAEGDVLDTAGTGGDGMKTINISTVAAIVAAAAGARVAKQTDRAVTSRCGSSEFLERHGVAIDLPSEAAARCIRETGLCFLSTDRYQAKAFGRLVAASPAGEAAALLRLLSRLANPAGAQHQLVGSGDAHRAEVFAEAIRRLGTAHCLVVGGDDGMDEVTCTRTTTVREVTGDRIATWTIDPREHGIDLAPKHAVLGGPPDENALITRFVLNGKTSPYRDIVELNAAAALLVADRVTSYAEGIALARETIQSGAAKRKLEQVAEASRALGARV
jgi:anthranilate phosphoribosyltransferase